MAKLKDDFPGFAELDAAGEATTAKVRKRIEAGTLTEVVGIGPAKEQQIKEAFDKLDAPDTQDEDDEPESPGAQTGAQTAAEKKKEGEGAGDGTGDQTLVNKGGVSDDALAAGEREQQKTGAQKNVELPNHDLGTLTPAEERAAGVADNQAQKLVRSGAVYVRDPAGAYASRTAVRIPEERGQIKVDPLHHVAPQRGMRVKDGTDEYVISDTTFGMDSKPEDWLRVRSPNTGKPFIE